MLRVFLEDKNLLSEQIREIIKKRLHLTEHIDKRTIDFKKERKQIKMHGGCGAVFREQ